MAKLTITNASKALVTYRGNLTDAATALDCSRTALYKFMDKHPILHEVREEAAEVLLDIAESHLTNAVEKGDLKSVRYLLDRKGKDRGYTTREERTGANGEPLQFEAIERTVVDPRDKKEE